MEKLTRTKKIFFTVLALNFSIFLIYGFIFFMVKNKNEHISLLLSDADRELKRDEFLLKTKLILNENEESIKQLDKYFVGRNEVPIFIESLERTAREIGVDLNILFVSVEAETRNRDDFKELLKMRVEVVGPWQNVFTFLKVLENLPFKASIQNASFSANKSQEDLFFGVESSTASSNWKGSIDFSLLKLK